MMSNLFSMFDTSTNSMYEMNWLSTMLNLLIMPISYWLFPSKIILLFNKILMIMYLEIGIILNNKFNQNNSILLISIFFFILVNNLMGLYPYIFTSSSHLIFSLSLSLPMWLSLMMFGWKNNLNSMFAHMIPQSTPLILMPFMVLIETISNLIRPMTLTIRLTANMIAGHLLLTLLSQSISNLLMINFTILMIQIILLMLEFSVAIIQSYVFTILSTLYTKEINYE